MLATGIALFTAAAIAGASVPTFAGATDFILVNGTATALGPLSIRRFQGGGWQSLAASPLPGGRVAVAFKHEDCAFDIGAKLGTEGRVVWSGVNLCEAEAVILRRDESGVAWVDYN